MKRQKNKITSQVHLFTVNNDAAGLEFIKNFRKSIRQSKTHVKVKLYGRGFRFGKGRSHKDPSKPFGWDCDNRFQSSVPIFHGEQKAQRIAVYVTQM